MTWCLYCSSGVWSGQLVLCPSLRLQPVLLWLGPSPFLPCPKESRASSFGTGLNCRGVGSSLLLCPSFWHGGFSKGYSFPDKLCR